MMAICQPLYVYQMQFRKKSPQPVAQFPKKGVCPKHSHIKRYRRRLETCAQQSGAATIFLYSAALREDFQQSLEVRLLKIEK
jgi:ribosomal protein S30